MMGGSARRFLSPSCFCAVGKRRDKEGDGSLWKGVVAYTQQANWILPQPKTLQPYLRERERERASKFGSTFLC